MKLNINKLYSIYNIIVLAIIIISIYNSVFGTIIHLDSSSNLSELWVSDENNPSLNNKQVVIQDENNESFITPPTSQNLRERIRRNISWYLSKDMITHNEFKKNWYPSRSVSRQVKTEIKDFLRNPYEYTTHKREWLLVDNCKYYIKEPNGTFFVQGKGYLKAKDVHGLTAKYGYVVHNDRFIKVNINAKNIGKIVTKTYFT